MKQPVKTSTIVTAIKKSVIDFANACGIDLTSDDLVDNDAELAYIAATIRSFLKHKKGEDIIIDCDTPGCSCNQHEKKSANVTEIKILSLKGRYKDGGSKQYKDANQKEYWLDNGLLSVHKGKLFVGNPNKERHTQPAVGNYFLTDTQSTITQS